jgi:hypothetical protein
LPRENITVASQQRRCDVSADALDDEHLGERCHIDAGGHGESIDRHRPPTEELVHGREHRAAQDNLLARRPHHNLLALLVDAGRKLGNADAIP